MGQFDSAGCRDGLTRRLADWLKIVFLIKKIFFNSENNNIFLKIEKYNILKKKFYFYRVSGLPTQSK
jgi:hypothetical protein